MAKNIEIQDLESDYKDIFPQYESFEKTQEWKKEGDIIREFTLFADYPPSYSSCDTITLS